MDDGPTISVLLLGDPDVGKSAFLSYACHLPSLHYTRAQRSHRSHRPRT